MVDNSVLNAARAYRAAGLSIIPVGKDKRPLCAWKPFQETQADETLIQAWFGRQSQPNLGIVCGQVSGGLLVLDFDHDARATYLHWKEAVGLLAEKLPAVKTGKGVHVYIRATDPGGNRHLATSADGRVLIETRGEGGYAIAPPSRHASGRDYHWIQGDHQIPFVSATALETILSAARALDAYQKNGSRVPSPVPLDPDQRLRRYATAILANEAAALTATLAGGRNERLNQAAFKVGRYAGAGLLAPLLVEQMLAAACGAGGNRLIDDDGLPAFRSTLQSGLEAGLAKAVDRDALLARLLERSGDG
jgi:hypothetical protein